MTGNKNQDTKDAFSVCQSGVDSVFNHVKHTIPQYHQSITNLQQECLQSCEDAYKSVLAVQKEYADNTGLNSFVSATALKSFNDGIEEFAKLASIRTQFALAAIDAAQQGVKTVHNNATFFAELHKNFVLPWTTMFFKKN